MSDEQPPDSQSPLAARIEDDTACLQCGYALRGLSLDDSCPECGLSIKLTRERLHGLSSRQLFTLGLRLFAVFVLAWPFIHDYGIVNNLIWMLLDDQGYNTYYGPDFVSMLIPGISAIVIAGAIWFAAPLLACIAAPVSYPLIANIGGPRTAMMIALCLFALWLIAAGAGDLMYGLGHYVTADPEEIEENLFGSIPGWVVSGLFRVIAGTFMLGWLNRNKEIVHWLRGADAS